MKVGEKGLISKKETTLSRSYIVFTLVLNFHDLDKFDFESFAFFHFGIGNEAVAFFLKPQLKGEQN